MTTMSMLSGIPVSFPIIMLTPVTPPSSIVLCSRKHSTENAAQAAPSIIIKTGNRCSLNMRFKLSLQKSKC